MLRYVYPKKMFHSGTGRPMIPSSMPWERTLPSSVAMPVMGSTVRAFVLSIRKSAPVTPSALLKKPSLAPSSYESVFSGSTPWLATLIELSVSAEGLKDRPQAK